MELFSKTRLRLGLVQLVNCCTYEMLQRKGQLKMDNNQICLTFGPMQQAFVSFYQRAPRIGAKEGGRLSIKFVQNLDTNLFFLFFAFPPSRDTF